MRKYWKDLEKGETCDIGLEQPVIGYKKNEWFFVERSTGENHQMWPNELVTVEYDKEYDKGIFDDCFRKPNPVNCHPEKINRNLSKAIREDAYLFWERTRHQTNTIALDISKKYSISRATANSLIRKFKNQKGEP